MEACGRRRRMLADEKVDSPNLGDFLRVKQDGGQSNLHSPSITLGAVLSLKKPPPPATETEALVHRTLLDIIRDDPSGAGSRHGDRMTWRTFKDKLRIRRAAVAWSSSVPIPASDVLMASGRRSTDPNTYSSQPSSAIGEDVIRSELTSTSSNRAMMTRHNSSRIPPSTSTYGRGSEEVEEEEEEERESEESENEGEPQARMSLMALLAETDRQMGLGESPFVMDDDDNDDEDEEEGVRLGVDEYNCCVCMVRHKGAALIPCGHTFCRLCSRELWVQRGNCPLCNNFILEILDIF